MKNVHCVAICYSHLNFYISKTQRSTFLLQKVIGNIKNDSLLCHMNEDYLWCSTHFSFFIISRRIRDLIIFQSFSRYESTTSFTAWSTGINLMSCVVLSTFTVPKTEIFYLQWVSIYFHTITWFPLILLQTWASFSLSYFPIYHCMGFKSHGRHEQPSQQEEFQKGEKSWAKIACLVSFNEAWYRGLTHYSSTSQTSWTKISFINGCELK